ncbi:hypothetical protein C2I18_00485 [Paenibacillus sp. PK3_47]|uniref:hypothetical protein n=1 Tax=Paenibacillus sp. PK3_47 TaxID=2072642 RepID=UPI00201E67E6|nr:hypothetical protein [Paenibacillus sp. PK3_47]UQZ32160.1 hypothetical protein C2I18_00485 [Paenibacillus sp. PK3_47]
MSKNKVWNRGKHNGGGLPKRNKPPVDAEASVSAPEEPVNARIDTVKPMNRSNWVSRPARVTPKPQDRNPQ